MPVHCAVSQTNPVTFLSKDEIEACEDLLFEAAINDGAYKEDGCPCFSAEDLAAEPSVGWFCEDKLHDITDQPHEFFAITKIKFLASSKDAYVWYDSATDDSECKRGNTWVNRLTMPEDFECQDLILNECDNRGLEIKTLL